MSVKYNNTRIYKLVSNQTDKIYIGHTTQKLNRRLQTHKKDFKRWKAGLSRYCTSYYLLENFTDVEIIEIEKYECKDIEEAKKWERHWIENLENTLNKNVPGRIPKEYREHYKEHYQELYKQNGIKREPFRSEKITCECGREMRRDSLAKHLTSGIHARILSKYK